MQTFHPFWTTKGKIVGQDMESVILFLKKAAEQISDPDVVLFAATKIANHKLMARYYTPEELQVRIASPLSLVF